MRPIGPGDAARRGGLAGAAAALAALLAFGCAVPPGGAPVVERRVVDEPTAAASRSASESAGRSSQTGTADSTQVGDWRPEVYTVQRGDTLYGIALDHGLDYREVAAWNGLSDPNLILAGQQLRMRAPAGWRPPEPEPERPAEPEPQPTEQVVARALAPQPPVEGEALQAPAPIPVKAEPKGTKVVYSDRAFAQMRGEPLSPPQPAASVARPTPPTTQVATAPTAAAAAPVPQPPAGPEPAPSQPAATSPSPATNTTTAAKATSENSAWIWPTRGKLLHGFNQGSNPKGVAIAGEAGQPVVASAAGKVVYSGNGLRGYGKLIIIKHSETYLSVYAHNRALLVKEGERVTKGQKIAEMGDTGAQSVALHFEIRRYGKPVDPLEYLPEGGAS